MDKSKRVIIDVRNAAEFKKAHAEGSINIPLPEMEERLDEIRAIKEPIVVVCGGGTRNGRAHELLDKHDIESTAGGSWKKYAE